MNLPVTTRSYGKQKPVKIGFIKWMQVCGDCTMQWKFNKINLQ